MQVLRSWYDVAIAIGELGQELELIDRCAKVRPITTEEVPNTSKDDQTIHCSIAMKHAKH